MKEHRIQGKALSIRQPWAYLICAGIKDVENQTWRTNYRGKILVHAPGEWDNRSRCMNRLFTQRQWDTLTIGVRYEMTIQYFVKFPTSAIIGSVEIVDCIDNSQSIWAEDHCYHWVLKNPVLFDKPILNVKGKLSFWNYQPERRNHAIK